MSIFETSPINGRQMTVGKIIFVNPPKPLDTSLGVGYDFVVHLGYCEHCRHRIALRLPEMAKLATVCHNLVEMTSKGSEVQLGANFEAQLKGLFKPLKGLMFHDTKESES